MSNLPRKPIPRFGDSVRITDPTSFYFGHVGRLISRDPSDGSYLIRLNSKLARDQNHWVWSDEFCALSSPPQDSKSNVSHLRPTRLPRRSSK